MIEQEFFPSPVLKARALEKLSASGKKKEANTHVHVDGSVNEQNCSHSL